MVINIFKKCLVCLLNKGYRKCYKCNREYLCDKHSSEHFCPPRYKEDLICYLVIGLIIGLFVFMIFGGMGEVNKANRFRAFTLRSGEVVFCPKESIKDCGVTLTKCWGGKAYSCQQDVTIHKIYRPYGSVDKVFFEKLASGMSFVEATK